MEVTLSAASAEGGQAVDLIACLRERVDSETMSWTLAEFEANRRAFLESLPGLVMTVDREHKIRSINRFINGFTEEQVIGASAFNFVMPDSQETVRRAFEQVFRTGQGTSYETAGPASTEGGTAWFAVYVSPIRRGDEVTALTLVTEEITERKRLQQELLASLERLRGYADELEAKNQQLAGENAERKRTEAALRAQSEVISRLSTPIIKAWEGVLALPIIGALDSERAAHIMERLLADIARTRSRFAVLDLTGVEVVDSETVGYIVNVVRAANLLGSRCLVSGISPSVARAMVALGSDMGAFPTFGQMQDALRYALAASGVQRMKAVEAAATPGEGRAGR
jgi:anti-anti-sigma factor